jgi:hypothetical protein
MNQPAPPNPYPNPGNRAAFLEHVRAVIRLKHCRPCL